MFNARKSLLFHSSLPWVKRDSDTLDVKMGVQDVPEICEPVGIFMLSFMTKNYSTNNIGLYRNNGFSAFRNNRVQEAEKHKTNYKNF